MDLHNVRVDILEHIFLRLDSSACLIRASTTCKRWRDVIAGTAFLQRYCSLHEPPVVGSYRNAWRRISRSRFLSCPRFEHSSRSPAIIDSRHLSLDFLPGDWIITDSRGSMLLLKEKAAGSQHHPPYMAVCEPLTRRHKRIPPPPLVAYPEQREPVALLVDGAAPGELAMSNFRVVYLSRTNGVVGVFTPSSDGSSWSELSIGSSRAHKMVCMGFAAGSVYWYARSPGRTRVYVYTLDLAAATFSTSELPGGVVEDFVEPIHSAVSKLAVAADVRDGRARILFLGAGNRLSIFARRKGCADGWVVERSVRLSPAMPGVPTSNRNLFFRPSAPLSARTRGTVEIVVASEALMTFSPAGRLDIHTMQVQRTTECNEQGYPIKLPWPPSLHAGTVHVC